MGDVDGVIVIPQQCAPPAIDLMRGRSAEDKITAEALKSGMSFTEATRRYRTYLRWLGTYVNGFESRSVWICRQGNLFGRFVNSYLLPVPLCSSTQALSVGNQNPQALTRPFHLSSEIHKVVHTSKQYAQ